MRLFLTSNIVGSLNREWFMEKDTSGGERPSRQEVSRLAYSFWEGRGCVDGNDVEDWLRAEEELKRHYA